MPGFACGSVFVMTATLADAIAQRIYSIYREFAALYPGEPVPESYELEELWARYEQAVKA